MLHLTCHARAPRRLRRRNRIERTASKRWRGSVRRVLSAVIYNLSCFSHGCSTGWVTGVLGREALAGGAWLSALPCLVALPAAPFFAVLAEVRGRRVGGFCVAVSFMLSWSLAAWCGPKGMWVARAAAGAGGAGALSLAPLYCAEIAPRTRGLAAMPALACSCGILYAFAAGGMLSPHALSLSMAVPPVVLLLSLAWLPETPSFLINVGRMQDAARVMCWFEGSDFREDLTDVIEQQEVRIRTSDFHRNRRDSDVFQPMLKRSSGLESNEDRDEPKPCRELFRHRKSRRALFSCCVLFCAAAGSGAGAVGSFATAILHSTHTVARLNVTAYNISIYNGTTTRAVYEASDVGALLCGVALVLGAAVAISTIDKVGRKTLLLWSSSGMACCLVLLGIYCDPRLNLPMHHLNLWPYKQIHQPYNLSRDFENYTLNTTFVKPWYRIGFRNGNLTEPHAEELMRKDAVDHEEGIWPPTVLLSIAMFLYNIGLGSVPYVLISEFFTVNVRTLASSLLIALMWLFNFLVLRYFSTAAISLGLHGTYYICATLTFLGFLYILLVLPETRGKSQEIIEEDLKGPLLVYKKRKTDDSR